MPRWAVHVARRAAVCLLLGAITTLIVAWSLRAYHQLRNLPPSPRRCSLEEDGQRWEATTFRYAGRFSITYQKLPPPGSQWQMLRTQGEPDPVPFTDEPAWAAAARHANPSLVSIGGYGLPWSCVMSLSMFSASGAVENVGIMTTPQLLGTLGGIRLPVRPIWTGLAADTAVFGSGWWMLLAGSEAIRRGVRRRRGQCIACGYNLAGNTSGACPECGARVVVR